MQGNTLAEKIGGAIGTGLVVWLGLWIVIQVALFFGCHATNQYKSFDGKMVWIRLPVAKDEKMPDELIQVYCFQITNRLARR